MKNEDYRDRVPKPKYKIGDIDKYPIKFCSRCGRKMKAREFSGFFLDEPEFDEDTGEKMEEPRFLKFSCPRIILGWFHDKYSLRYYKDGTVGSYQFHDL